MTLVVSENVHAEEKAPTTAELQEAASAFDRGRSAFRAENYTEAAQHFETADDYAPSPASLQLAMIARKEAGQLDRAASLAALLVERFPEEKKAVAGAKEVLALARPELMQVNIRCTEECVLTVDGKLLHGGGSLNRQVYLQPGEYTVRAGFSEERGTEKPVDGAAGEELGLLFEAPALPKEAPPVVVQSQSQIEPIPPVETMVEAEPSSGLSPTFFWTGVGMTGAGLGASIFLSVYALNNPGKDAVTEECQEQGKDCPAYQEGIKNQRNANIAWGATAAVGVLTAISGIWWTDWHRGDKETALLPSFELGRLHVRPVVTLGPVGYLGAEGTF
ncbi:MAG: outer membrane protein assembly factor BamD [Polyangiaceae bacterium]|nr:outer membrane protein assembly factor BamD [Polyangiaceae bacterium]